MLQGSLSKVNMEVEMLTLGSRLEWSDVSLIGNEPIASGSYGEVWRGYLHKRHEVAIKMLTKSESKGPTKGGPGATIQDMDDAELRFLQRARHKHLVMFFGGGMADGGKGFVVLEFMNRGDLSNFLWGKDDGGLPWNLRLTLLSDAAAGMRFLHDDLNSIHRDLKSPNILLASDNTGALIAKIADFGMAKVLGKCSEHRIAKDDEERRGESSLSDSVATKEFEIAPSLGSGKWTEISMTTERGTPQWMSPEEIHAVYCDKDTAKYSAAVDVYAFGIILWEALSLRAPWKEHKRYFEVWKRVYAGKRPGVHSEDAAEAPRGYIELMRACWHQDPSERPRFSDALQSLQIMALPREHWETLPSVSTTLEPMSSR
eukprot:g2302.t1